MNIKTLIKSGKYISIGSIILVPLIWIFLKEFELLTFKLLGLTLYTWLYAVSWYAVVFVMAIRPLADLFPKYKLLRQLCILRRGFGILSAMVIVTLLFDKWLGSPNSFYAFFSLSAWSWGYPVVARLSEITTLILLCTSNDFSQKKLKKNWKRIQRTSYIYFVSGGVLALRYGDDYGIMISLIVVLALYFVIFIKKGYIRWT